MSDDGGTVGVWVPGDDDTIEKFDEQFADGPGYSRSAAILDALDTATQLDRALERSPYDVRLGDREAIPLLREALRALESAEFGEE